MIVGFMLLGTFVVLQLKSEKPMLNLRVFGNPGFRIAVILSLCMYLIAMGNAMVLPIFAKSIRGFSDTSYGLATIVGSILSVITTLSAGRLYDKVGIRPMFIVGTGLFAVYSVMGFLFSQNTSIIYIAVAFAVQTIAMSALNSPTTAMALSGLEGRERVDGSAIFNTLRQISSSLASTLAVLIYTLAGSNLPAMHGVYVYFGLVTIAIGGAVILYLKGETKNKES